MDRKLNALFTFILVVVFISVANVSQQWDILLGVLLASTFSFLAFSVRYLSLDGMFAAIVIGTFVFGLGGWPATIVLLLFFISGTVITTKRPQEGEYNGRRDGLQVWANGFWLIVCLLLSIVFENSIFMIGAMAVLATAASDTWATELGSTAPNATYLITNFRKVRPGTDGGVSVKGTIAALFASALIAATTIYVFSLHLNVFFSIFTAGFLGCLFDSYFGATFQQNNSSVALPAIQSTISVDNNLVNGLSTGAGALLAIILNLLIA